jgi:hypothetical protein
MYHRKGKPHPNKVVRERTGPRKTSQEVYCWGTPLRHQVTIGADSVDDEEPLEDDADVRNDLWVKENYIGLCDEFPNQWIAVADQDVIASGATKRQTEKKAEEIAQGRRFSLYFMEPSALPP